MCDLTNPIYNNADAARKHLEAIRWADLVAVTSTVFVLMSKENAMLSAADLLKAHMKRAWLRRYLRQALKGQSTAD